jgi:hypothetical protein
MGRCKCPSYGPNQAYLLSFGDCMTALLAFFIVLNSMAKEQTGANLYSGTGSFNAALNSHGLTGVFPANHSKNPQQMNDVAPMYMVGDPEQDDFGPGVGPDETDDNGRIIDRQEEQFSRFLDEVRRMSTIQEEPGIQAEVSLDVMAPIPQSGSLLSPELQKTLTQVRPVFRKADRLLEITVWATTPSQSAWTRAAQQAVEIRKEAIKFLKLDPSQQTRISASGRTWISSTVKRPSVSVVLRKTESTRSSR